MFHAIRHWWIEGRGKLTARLFVFELFVVTLGVLLAQGIANWSQRRAAVGQMRDATARWEADAAAMRFTTFAWNVAVPCFDARMDDVLLKLSQGPIVPELAVRPQLRFPILQPLGEADTLVARKMDGSERVDAMADMSSIADRMNRAVLTIAEQWGRLSVAANGHGPVTEEDRSVARVAAEDIKAQVRNIQLSANYFEVAADRMGIAILKEPNFRSARTCSEIWQTNSMTPMRERQP